MVQNSLIHTRRGSDVSLYVFLQCMAVGQNLEPVSPLYVSPLYVDLHMYALICSFALVLTRPRADRSVHTKQPQSDRKR